MTMIKKFTYESYLVFLEWEKKNRTKERKIKDKRKSRRKKFKKIKKRTTLQKKKKK